jgi:hypothetical protein
MTCPKCKGEGIIYNPEWDHYFDRASDTIPDNQICEQEANRLADRYIQCPECQGTGEK